MIKYLIVLVLLLTSSTVKAMDSIDSSGLSPEQKAKFQNLMMSNI